MLTLNTLISRALHIAGLTALLLVNPVHGQDRDFDLPGAEFTELTSDGGWYAENDSYAFGVGGNLHLLDDDLRLKFGAGYMNVRYRFYGIGERNDLGVSVDIRQEAPMYFTSASYRIWKKLYVGTEYYFGVGEAF